MDIRPEWDEYFIEIAKVVSKRSTCIRRKYGAVIAKVVCFDENKKLCLW